MQYLLSPPMFYYISVTKYKLNNTVISLLLLIDEVSCIPEILKFFVYIRDKIHHG